MQPCAVQDMCVWLKSYETGCAPMITRLCVKCTVSLIPCLWSTRNIDSQYCNASYTTIKFPCAHGC